MFKFEDEDYELTVKDKIYLQSLNKAFPQHPDLLSEKEFERILDCLEKVAFMYRNDQPTFVTDLFFKHADNAIRLKLESLPQNLISKIVTEYWKKRKIELKWHAFYRKFW